VASDESPAAWSELTEEQADAVRRRDGSLLLAANAGSGKTSVLVERFVASVLEDGLAPAQILTITFTERAAGELRERIRRRLLSLGARQAARDTEAAYVQTIHGFCARVLRQRPLAAGLDPEFTVLDEFRAQRIRERAFEGALASWLERSRVPAALDLVAAWGVDRLATAIIEGHEALRSRGQRRPALPPVPPRPAPARERTALAHAGRALTAELSGAARGHARTEEALRVLAGCAQLLEGLGPDEVPLPGPVARLRLASGNAAALNGPLGQAYATVQRDYERACADHHGAAAVALLDELLTGFADSYAAAKRARSARAARCPPDLGRALRAHHG
jgi:hypothetical protein